MIDGTVAIALALSMTMTEAAPATPEAAPVAVTQPVLAPAELAPAETLNPAAASPELAAASQPVGVGPARGPSVAVEGPVAPELRAPEPAWTGRGLLIGAGVMGGINVGLAIARLGLGLGEVTAEREHTRLLLTAVATPIDLAAGIGLAAAGGHYRGRHDGYRTAYELKPKLNAKAFTASGTILLVMGVVAWASAWTPWHGDATLDGRGNGTLMVESAGSLLLMGGSGLLAYGVSWNKHARLYGRSTRAISVRPAAGPGFAGLRLSGRF